MPQLRKAACFLCWFLLLWRCLSAQKKKEKTRMDLLKEQQGQCLGNALKCVMLLNEWGSVGCAQCGESVVRGSLKIIDTQDSATEIKTGEFENDIIMSTESFAFSPKGVLETMNRRANAARAIIVAQHTEFWNDKDKIDANGGDNTTLGSEGEDFPYPPIRLYSADKKIPNENYLFEAENNGTNPSIPHGTGLIYGRFPVNMFWITDSDSDKIREAHRRIQNRSGGVGAGKRRTAPVLTMESRGRMSACPAGGPTAPQPSPGSIISKVGEQEPDSKECLSNNTCLPVGGYSVWSSVSPINETTFNTSETREIVAVTAPMDSAALFHDMAFGAAAEIASVAALMAVVKSVGDYSRTTLTPIKKHPMYFAFNAQSWGFSGSGRFLEDVTSFQCKSLNATDGFCNDPISPSMKFKQLNNANFSVINLGGLVSQERIENKKPITTAPHFFMHGFRGGNKNGTGGDVEMALIRQFKRANLNLSDGFRNASFMDASQTFQHYSPDADVVTLTNFKQNFTNRYYHSLFDNATLISPEARQPLYKAARAVANTVIELCFGDSNAETALEGDLIDAFIDCLTSNWSQKNCSLAEEYLGDDYPKVFKAVVSSNYAGVFVPPDFALERNPSSHIKSLFLQRFMAYHTRLGPEGVIRDNSRASVFKTTKCDNVTQCERVDGVKSWMPVNFKNTFCAKGACVSAESHLHAAFGTGLKDINAARSKFEVIASSPAPSPSPRSAGMLADPVQPAWTESNWRKLDLCYQIRDTRLFGGAVLGSGLATFVICLMIAWFLNPRRAFFKVDSDEAYGQQPISDVQP